MAEPASFSGPYDAMSEELARLWAGLATRPLGYERIGPRVGTDSAEAKQLETLQQHTMENLLTLGFHLETSGYPIQANLSYRLAYELIGRNTPLATKTAVCFYYAASLEISDSKKSLGIINFAKEALQQASDGEVGDRRPWEDVTLFAIRAFELALTSRIEYDHFGPYNYELYNQELRELLLEAAELLPTEAALPSSRRGMYMLIRTLHTLKGDSQKLARFNSVPPDERASFGDLRLSDPLLHLPIPGPPDDTLSTLEEIRKQLPLLWTNLQRKATHRNAVRQLQQHAVDLAALDEELAQLDEPDQQYEAQNLRRVVYFALNFALEVNGTNTLEATPQYGAQLKALSETALSSDDQILKAALLTYNAAFSVMDTSSMVGPAKVGNDYWAALELLADYSDIEVADLRALISFYQARDLGISGRVWEALKAFDDTVEMLNADSPVTTHPWKVPLFGVLAHRLDMASRTDPKNRSRHSEQLRELLDMLASLPPTEASLQINQAGMIVLADMLKRYGLEDLRQRVLHFKNTVQEQDVQFDMSGLSDPLIPEDSSKTPAWELRENPLTRQVASYYLRARQNPGDESLKMELSGYLSDLGLKVPKNIRSLWLDEINREIRTAQSEALILLSWLTSKQEPEVARILVEKVHDCTGEDFPDDTGLLGWTSYCENNAYLCANETLRAGLPLSSKIIFVEQALSFVRNGNCELALDLLKRASEIDEFHHEPYRPWELLYPDLQLAVDELIGWYELSRAVPEQREQYLNRIIALPKRYANRYEQAIPRDNPDIARLLEQTGNDPAVADLLFPTVSKTGNATMVGLTNPGGLPGPVFGYNRPAFGFSERMTRSIC